MANKHSRRRGVVILVVLSLLVLFVLIAVTFAVLAGHYRRTSEAVGRREQLGESPKRLMDRAMYELLRDTKNDVNATGSALRLHSLLRDMYGVDGFRGYVADSTTLTDLNLAPDVSNPDRTGARVYSDAQFYDLQIINSSPYQPKDFDGNNYTLSQTRDFYAGRVLTFLSGDANNLSTRIVGWLYNTLGNGEYILRIMVPRRDDGVVVSLSQLAGAEFIVNGAAFNGTGFGYHRDTTTTPDTISTSATGDVTVQGNTVAVPLSLIPNYAYHTNATTLSTVLGGGSDEGYDGGDYQNMALALLNPTVSVPGDVLPSFHRPNLIEYWQNQTITPNPAPSPSVAKSFWADLNVSSSNPPFTATISPFKRLALMRPFEKNFDGSNPDYATALNTYKTGPAYDETDLVAWFTDGPWDVDNDGDGIADSIWIDLGMPVQTSPDGRRYKPLFAIMCQDLDGRLSVNAHDRIAHTDIDEDIFIAGTVPDVDAMGNPITRAKKISDLSGDLVGLGYGPPEISLNNITGNLNQLLSRRYSSSDSGDYHPGQRNMYDYLARLSFFEEPENYFHPGTNQRSTYSSPADLYGELKVGLNRDGQPIFSELLNTITESRQDSPYEINLIDRTQYDRPYTPQELERVLRSRDLDRNMLSRRLANLVNTNAERLVTTHGFDLPVPSVRSIGEMTDDVPQPSTFAELLRKRLADSGTTDLDSSLLQLLPFEVMRGLRMDLNRPFGNGRDETTGSNDVADDPGESALTGTEIEEVFGDVIAADSKYGSTDVDHTNGLADRRLGRQLYAAHLYVMMLTLMDHGGAGSAPDPAVAARVAQWAVNVVDFRDADSIMTPFEYDPNPFNDADGDGIAWDNDGTVNGHNGLSSTDDNNGSGTSKIVWGCERPELLLMEALAYHDRRTTDGADDPTGERTTDTPPNDDDDYDQLYLPIGTAFVELYNPWNGTDAANTPPEELHGGNNGVNLHKTTPTSGHPVWRLLVVNKEDYISGNPINIVPDIGNDQVDPAAGGTTVERAVYFSNPSSLPSAGAPLYFYPDPTQAKTVIAPGEYAVIAGGDRISVNQYISPMGEIDPNWTDASGNGPANPGDYPRIEARPGTGIDFYPGNGGAAVSVAVDVVVPDQSNLPATAIRTSFNISEPLGGYPIDPNASSHFTDANSRISGFYEDAAAIGTGTPVAVDEPLDKSQGEHPNEIALSNGTTRRFCRVYLQRLANPLDDFNSNGNPYVTVDSIPVDLTVFNGSYDYISDSGADPDVNNNFGNIGVDFSAVQRGDSDGAQLRIWRQAVARTAAGAQGNTSGPQQFDFTLTTTLGSLNTGYSIITNNPQTINPPWLLWNNRPFASAYELLQVPMVSSWDLMRRRRDPVSNTVEYYFNVPTTTPAPDPYDADDLPYPYLPRFFAVNSTAGRWVPHMYRLLEYVDVPSRFTGTYVSLNPDTFDNNNTVTRGLRPPFNRISRYREPGRVNINTIMSDTVWNAVCGYTGAPSFNDMVTSRRGAAGSYVLPTKFANLFRPVGSGTLVPYQSGLHASIADLDQMIVEDISTTLLRPDPTDSTKPLMRIDDTELATHSKNSFFRYRLLHRLGNVLTTRSNTYAVWITMGYFEVEENPLGIDTYHPDGFRVAKELGIDTGEVERHRAFYMIDRSVPVAFEPGKNHNVDNCILLRRFIE